MREESINKIHEYIKEMPCLNVSAGKVMEICNNVKVDASQLNRLISLDPVLTGRLLQLHNSSFFGLGPHVTSLVRSVTMLGVNTVKNIACSGAVLAQLPENKNINGMDMEVFWRHCMYVGVTARMLAVKQGIDPIFHEEYYIAGLLHDIGKVPLNAVFSADYAQAATVAVSENIPFPAVEDGRFGINHCLTGAMIAGVWKIEAPVADVIIHHHNARTYTGENKNILYTVAIADYFSSLYDMGFAGGKTLEKPDPEVWEECNIGENAHEELENSVRGEIENAHKFLKT